MAKAGTVRAGSGLLPEKFLGGTKRMKKIIALLLALVMVFALVACSSKTTDDTAKDDTTTPAATTHSRIPPSISPCFTRWRRYARV